MGNKVEKLKTQQQQISKWGKIIIVVGPFLVLIAPLILTRDFGLSGFVTTGQIGDTIGGITAPITGLVGAILVYLALKAQITANEIVLESINEQTKNENELRTIAFIMDSIKLLINDLKEFTYSTDKGSKAFKNVLDYNKNTISHKEYSEKTVTDIGLYEIYCLMKQFDYIFNLIKNSKIPESDKAYSNALLSMQYNMHIFQAIVKNNPENNEDIQKCEECGVKHIKIPYKIFVLHEDIKSKLVNTENDFRLIDKKTEIWFN